MIVIVEGVDRVGKTTLVKKLVKRGFVTIKDEFIAHQPESSPNFAVYSGGKCESFAVAAKQLSDAGLNVVIDRLHLTEYVYGMIDRDHNCDSTTIWSVDMQLAAWGAYLVYVEPEDISLTNDFADRDLTTHISLFEKAVNLSSMPKFITRFSELDEMAHFISGFDKSYDFYFASPFFNPEQVEREERMIAHLRLLGFKVYSPKEESLLDAKATQEARQDTFKDNCEAIRKSRAVFAVTDGKDMGTIWEAGYAYGVGTPIIYYAETLGNNKFNLMLAESGVNVFTSQEEVTKLALLDSFAVTRKFRGDIE